MKNIIGPVALGLRFATACILTALAPTIALAEPMKIEIREQKMVDALNALAEQLQLQLLYDGKLVRDLNAPAVSGTMEPEAALQRVLAGSGLAFRFVNKTTVTIERAAVQGITRNLGPVRVEGVDAATLAGINGSTDVTATEGTGSYTSSHLSVGSKAPRSIRESPQTVSVITQQRMQDQNINDFGDLMSQAAGVSTVISGDPMAPKYYARGFEIERLSIDGGAPIQIASTDYSTVIPQIDMAMFDHAEILRGADGLFNGYGNPGGVINLTRKRPLDHGQVKVEGQVGSWNNTRTVIDATAPLGFDGKLRGRAVLSYQDQDYFYKIANNNKTMVYGILEYDLLPSITLNTSYNSTRQSAVPFQGGLPRYQTGDDLHLSRDTCLCFPWNTNDFDTDQIMAGATFSPGNDWTVNLNVSQTQQERSYKVGTASGTINPITLLGSTYRARMRDLSSEQFSSDFVANGSFELFGQRQVIVIGGNYSTYDGGGFKDYTQPVTGNTPINVFSFDPANYPEPAGGVLVNDFPELNQTQWALYTDLRLTFWNRLHLSTGTRFSYFGSTSRQFTFCTQVAGCPRPNSPTIPYGEPTLDYSHDYGDHDVSWPPSWSLAFDLSDSLSMYGSYMDIYQSQATYVDHDLMPIAPLTGSNIEVGLKWAPRGGRLNVTLGVYQLEQKGFGQVLDFGDYEDTDGELPDGVHRCCYVSDQNKSRRSNGVDFEVSGEVLPGWQLQTSYSFNDNKQIGASWFRDEGKPMVTQAPQHIFKLDTMYRFKGQGWLGRLNIGAGIDAQSKGYYVGTVCLRFITRPNGTVACDTTPGSSVPYDFTQGFYKVFSLQAGYRIDPRWTAQLNVENLTDLTYYRTVGTATSGNWYGNPRSYTLTLRGAF